jgi:hypothetical protein
LANKNGLGILLLLGLGYYFLNKKPSRAPSEVIARNGGGLILKSNGYAFQPVEEEYFEEEILPSSTPTGRRRTKRTLVGTSPTSELAGELAREQYMESVFKSITV